MEFQCKKARFNGVPGMQPGQLDRRQDEIMLLEVERRAEGETSRE